MGGIFSSHLLKTIAKEKVNDMPAMPAIKDVLDFPDIIQNEQGLGVQINRSRDDKLTTFGKATMDDRYLMPDESYQDNFARVAVAY